MTQLALNFAPKRVRFDGVPGTVVDTFPARPGYQESESALVAFDGPHEWASEYKMASVAGCRLLVLLDDCEAAA